MYFLGTRHILGAAAGPRGTGTDVTTYPVPRCTTVFVWEPVAGVGHAAIAIGDQARFTKGHWYDQTVGYASWFPGQHLDDPDESGADASGLLPGVMYMKQSCTFEDDCNSEGGLPEHAIPVRGLRVSSMMTRWTEIRDKPNAHYRLLRKNCSTIVARILRAGFAGLTNWQVAKLHFYAHKPYWTPEDIRTFAQTIRTMG
jgi:hypothetical protein